jgi:FixJ family two-component response regulator
MAGSRTADVAIIEDDAHLRNSIKDFLEAAGYSSELFRSADIFLDSGRYRSFGCILADVRMPGTSGIDMLRYLKTHPDCPPILIMTSYSDDQMRATAHKLGAVGFLAKPIDTSLLLQLIYNAVGVGNSPY